MSTDYTFIADSSASSDDESLEQLIGLKKSGRPKRSKAPPLRYRDQNDDIMEENLLEEIFSKC